MTSAGWYFKQGARKVFVATAAEARRLAKQLADQTRKQVPVGYDPPPRAGSSAKRNPVMRGHDYTGESWRIRAMAPSGATLTAYEDTKSRAEGLARLLRRQKYAAVTIAQVRKPNARRDNLVKLPKVMR